MDRKIGLTGAAVVIVGVIVFAVCMLTGPLALCYGASIAIAWGLVMMNSAFFRFSRADAKAAAMCAVAFGTMYALCNSIVYFVQITTVKNGALTGVAAQLLDYRTFSMMFDLDMLGYCLMAVSTFFAGLTIRVRDKGDRALKALLLIHGAFAVTCFAMPVLGVFSSGMEGADWIGTAVLEFWCAFFLPIGILSYRYFSLAEK
ncbi:MAG: hypothetical protein Q8S22_07600 [Eubacteriales bacterium]|nr:hypothetical protein [Eubacteriales bacterium]